MNSTAETAQINNDDKTEINITENEETQMTTQSQALGVLLNAFSGTPDPFLNINRPEDFAEAERCLK